MPSSTVASQVERAERFLHLPFARTASTHRNPEHQLIVFRHDAGPKVHLHRVEATMMRPGSGLSPATTILAAAATFKRQQRRPKWSFHSSRTLVSVSSHARFVVVVALWLG